MAERTEGRPTDGLSVMVIDEDKRHANSARSMLCKLNFYVTAYSSPIEALRFLENHAQDVDFVLAAVHMEELSGFQFLEVAREVHKNLQVIMMSTETTMYIMKRCVELGARFLVKKPLDAETMNNIWQHLDLKVLRMEKIMHLFRGVRDETYGGQDMGECAVHQKDGTKKRTFLIWTPYLQRKFLHALKILGEDARPKKIDMIMNVDVIDREQISSHLQKHRKKMKREQNKAMVANRCWNGALNYKSMKSRHTSPNTTHYHSYCHSYIQPAEIATMQSFSGDTQGSDVYTAMRRALQLGTVFDESQYSNDEANEAGEDVMGGDASDDEADGSNSPGDDQVVAETYSADAEQDITSNNNSDVKVSRGSDEAAVVNLVNYPDSEDDDEVEVSE